MNSSNFESVFNFSFIITIIMSIIFVVGFIIVAVIIVKRFSNMSNKENVDIAQDKSEDDGETINTKVNIGGINFSFSQTIKDEKKNEVVCKYCGAKNKNSEKTCSNCGAVL